jgi:hypothetical protein
VGRTARRRRARRLADATEALERGRLDQPVGVGGRDEMGRLALAFESLARELAERSRVADDTLHRLGHDLAEPLVTLRDATRVLAGELGAEPRQQQLAQLIGDAADDLVRRVDRITEHPTAPKALEGPALKLLDAPLRMLPEPMVNDEERVVNVDAGRRGRDGARGGPRYVSDADPGIRRRRKGKGFEYLDAQGRRIGDRHTVARIRALVIPPAWRDVWICPRADGHIQAIGRDARGRKQYRYHADWREVRDATKYERMVPFARRLPAIRRRVAQDLKRQGLPREKVLALVVRLLETTSIRVGNSEYARTNGSFGLTTLRGRHVAGLGRPVRFRFKGKSGKLHEIDVEDRRLARLVARSRTCRARSSSSTSTTTARRADRLGRRERVPARDRGRGVHGEGLPHVGRHRRRRARAGGSARTRVRGRDEARGRRRDQGRRRAARQHGRRLPEVLRAPAGARRVRERRDARHGDARRRRGLTADERATLALLAPRPAARRRAAS